MRSQTRQRTRRPGEHFDQSVHFDCAGGEAVGASDGRVPGQGARRGRCRHFDKVLAKVRDVEPDEEDRL